MCVGFIPRLPPQKIDEEGSYKYEVLLIYHQHKAEGVPSAPFSAALRAIEEASSPLFSTWPLRPGIEVKVFCASFYPSILRPLNLLLYSFLLGSGLGPSGATKRA
uniref:Uncharacterized protein ORF104_2 n=1 Tax=Nothoceros aenigmaticus TaxID=13813 RepID=C3RYP3_9EMBR|nr:hypothetical protein MeaeMp40 [Nothoceros aenigmaticus]ACC86799.1 hypothetical protein MeaeMp40 [Nothoceros aenigmaticus]